MFLLLLVIALVRVYRYYETRGEDLARIEQFLEDYRAMKPTRFTYADIKRITNGLSESLGEGAHGTVFKGMLSPEILVALKILNDTVRDGNDFINEVEIIGKIHHVNVVRLLGFCADGFHRALVYDFFPNGSLKKFFAPPDNKDVFLGGRICNKLLLMIGGRKNMNVSNDESFQVLYPEWVHNLLEDRDVHISIEDEVHTKIAKKLAIVGLWCIQWNPVDRPSMKTVVQMLEGDENELIAPPTPFDISHSSRANVVVPTRRLNLELEVIHEIED
ncbi:hypothetical protein VNO78_30716 [Psophocarpus tetragonolobus]|uniref:Protein kinase domain-containing protein n=1 Tax=Psophocarpus tetragonolobus TaxID=3891 RepID=A0AAN9RX48_PSOTE